MEIKALDVKKLREKTGAGMLDCKNALQEAQGDFAKAEKILKELGLAAAAKRSDRATREGRIFSAIKGNTGALLELTCETDFVAKNQDFINYGTDMVNYVVDKKLSEMDSTLEDKVKSALSHIKENITCKRFKCLQAADNEMLVEYVHGVGSIGVLVKLQAADKSALNNEEVKAFAFDCALHIAAFNPLYLNRDAVDPAYISEQEEIFTKQASNLGKPENVLAGIVKGKINKHLAEICLMNQGFVKDEKQTVEAVMKEIGKKTGTELKIAEYLYYKTGEEI